jgi:hypothetical protein
MISEITLGVASLMSTVSIVHCPLTFTHYFIINTFFRSIYLIILGSNIWFPLSIRSSHSFVGRHDAIVAVNYLPLGLAFSIM